MKVKLSPLMRKVLQDPKAREQLSEVMAGKNTLIEVDGKKYRLVFGPETKFLERG